MRRGASPPGTARPPPRSRAGSRTRGSPPRPASRLGRGRVAVLAVHLGAERRLELLRRGVVELGERDRVALALDAQRRATVFGSLLVPSLAGREAEAARHVGLALVHQDPGGARDRLGGELELDLADVLREGPITHGLAHQGTRRERAAGDRTERAVVAACAE